MKTMWPSNLHLQTKYLPFSSHLIYMEGGDKQRSSFLIQTGKRKQKKVVVQGYFDTQSAGELRGRASVQTSCSPVPLQHQIAAAARVRRSCTYTEWGLQDPLVIQSLANQCSVMWPLLSEFPPSWEGQRYGTPCREVQQSFK